MSESINLTAEDGHQLSAYLARPEGEPIAGLVVVQEVFGVNGHIRSVADGYLKDGFLAVAPALFDRIERGVELSYEGADMQRAMTFAQQLDLEKALADIAAAIEFAASATGKKTGVIGYCFGGTMAWVAAARLNPAAAVGYYAGRIGNYAAEKPTAPVMLHFGSQDTHIPAAEVEKVHYRPSRSRNPLVRRRPRLQLRRSRQLQRRSLAASARTLLEFPEEASGLGSILRRLRPFLHVGPRSLGSDHARTFLDRVETVRSKVGQRFHSPIRPQNLRLV
jgi:carboxymethylenebutenolidase